MEFNRLLSQAINFYGEPGKKISMLLPSKTLLKIDTKKNIKVFLMKKI